MNNLDFLTPVIPEEKQHENFKSIKEVGFKASPPTEKDYYTHISHNSTRKMISEWSEGMPDRDHKVVKEFQETFNSTFWEIYLYALFKECGAQFFWEHSSPDFHISINNLELIIEATIAEAANGKLNEWDKNPLYDYVVDNDALNKEAMVRLLNSIYSKVSKYNKIYKKLPHTSGKPFILAVNGFEQPGFFFKADRPMRAILYDDYVDETLYKSNPSKYPYGPPSTQLGFIEKDNGTELDLGIFLNSGLSEISAIIHNPIASTTKASILGVKKYPSIDPVDLSRILNPIYADATGRPILISEYNETIFDGLQVYHNPHADYPLDYSIFHVPGATQYTYENGTVVDYVSGPSKTIVSRTMTGINGDADQKMAKMMIECQTNYIRSAVNASTEYSDHTKKSML